MPAFPRKLLAPTEGSGTQRFILVSALQEHIPMPSSAILFPPVIMEKCTILSIIYAIVLTALLKEDTNV